MYSDNENFVWALAEKKLTGKSLWQMRNAKKFLDQAWEIRSIDPAMAKFRALNAVEEASCALVEVLKENYDNAKRINTRDHSHKMAVVAGLVLGQSEMIGHVSLAFNKETNKIHFRIKGDGDSLPTHTSSPNFYLGKKGNPVTCDELNVMTSSEFGNRTAFNKLLHDTAGRRDKILYATKSGPPATKWDAYDEPFLVREQVNAATAIGVACVLKDADKSPFVEQILLAIVTHLNLRKEEMGRIKATS